MNGIPGVDSPGGYVCCKASCGVCGGAGCSDRGPAMDCCVTEILSEGNACADVNESPCFVGDREYGQLCFVTIQVTKEVSVSCTPAVCEVVVIV